MEVEIFPIAGECIDAVWLHPPESPLNRRLNNSLMVPAGIYSVWSLVVRTDTGALHGLQFTCHDTMIHSGRNPLYEKMMHCHKLYREECLEIIAWVATSPLICRQM